MAYPAGCCCVLASFPARAQSPPLQILSVDSTEPVLELVPFFMPLERCTSLLRAPRREVGCVGACVPFHRGADTIRQELSLLLHAPGGTATLVARRVLSQLLHLNPGSPPKEDQGGGYPGLGRGTNSTHSTRGCARGPTHTLAREPRLPAARSRSGSGWAPPPSGRRHRRTRRGCEER